MCNHVSRTCPRYRSSHGKARQSSASLACPTSRRGDRGIVAWSEEVERNRRSANVAVSAERSKSPFILRRRPCARNLHAPCQDPRPRLGGDSRSPGRSRRPCRCNGGGKIGSEREGGRVPRPQSLRTARPKPAQADVTASAQKVVVRDKLSGAGTSGMRTLAVTAAREKVE